jgi:hypothetical protein
MHLKRLKEWAAQAPGRRERCLGEVEAAALFEIICPDLVTWRNDRLRRMKTTLSTKLEIISFLGEV